MATFDDDYSSDINTTGVLTVGGSLNGKINYAYDIDWVKTTLVAGTTYVFGLNQPGEMMLRLTDGSQPLAGGYGQTWVGPAFEYTPSTTGDYYLTVSYGYQRYTTDYTLTAAVKPPDAVPGNITTTAVLGAGATVHGSMEVAGDADWYKFHAEPGQHYLFGWTSSDSAISDLAIYDSKGQPTGSYMLEVAQAGDYYIAVTGNHAGEYDLKSFVRTDDYTANDTAPGLLQPGGQLKGSIEYASDTDRIYIDLQAGSVYTLTLTGNASSSMGLEFELTDASGKFVDRIGDGDYTDKPQQLTFTAQASGKYAIDVRDWDASTTKHHDYILTASGGTPDDYGDTAATATAVSLGAAVRGVSSHGQDVDMLKLTLKAGVSYTLKLSPDATHGATSTAVSLDVFGPDGTTKLTPAGTTFTPTANGDYYIAIRGRSSTADYYVFTASAAQDDYGANTDNAGRLALNGTASGTLETYGDRDWFALDMTAGQTYGISMQRPPNYNNTGPGYYTGTLKIVDAQGNVVASMDGSYSSTPLLSYTATSSGKFYVEIGSSGGAYLLGAKLVQHDDAGNTPAGAVVLPLGATLNGALEISSDLDYYKLSVVAGETYAIQLKDVVANDFWRPSLQVTDNHGAYVRSSGDVTLVTASTSGDVYLKISGESGAPTIAYQLISTALGADDYGSGTTSTTTGALPVGGAVRGVINYADDTDWFKVSLQAGVTYQFDLQDAIKTNGAPSYYDAPLILFDSKHNRLTTDSYGTSLSKLGYTATASGDYYVQVQSKGNASANGSYVLSAQAIPTKPLLMGPGSGAAGLHDITEDIVLSFNEDVQVKGYGSGIKLIDEAGNSLGLQSFPSTFGNTVVLRFNTTHLAPGATYKIEIADNTIVNTAGVSLDSVKGYTITTAPAVTTGGSGGSGDDLLIGKHNGASLHGGAGLDTVIYNDSNFFYRIVRSGDQATVTYTLGSNGGSDTLDGVERLLFNYNAIALDIDGHGGQAYRLYQAAFGRTPDKDGLGYWIKALDQGSSLAHVASEFVNSAEFLSRSGGASSDDATFVTLLYNNVLHRTPDVTGLQYWFDALRSGATRADLLQSFSESAENQAALIGVIGNGFEYTPYGG
jgi:hypothetical protein